MIEKQELVAAVEHREQIVPYIREFALGASWEAFPESEQSEPLNAA
jgi:hypothetical protein